jgi:hypothetical protein
LYSLDRRALEPYTHMRNCLVAQEEVYVSRKLYFGEVPNELTSRYARLLLGE